MKQTTAPIGIFDSGYGGLTIFKAIAQLLPQYDFVYLGDNARAPYGNRSYETVYEYTLECVQWLMQVQYCPLVILACNTASAKALRTIQQKDLIHIHPDYRVLGVIRPTAEIVGAYTTTKHIGILGTLGTVNSQSYLIEIHKFFEDAVIFQHACPMWVPFIENNEYLDDGIDYYIKKDIQQLLSQSDKIDTVLLACTHYPILIDKIRKFLPTHIKIVTQGDLVAESLQHYLHRHIDLDNRLTKDSHRTFYTTDDPIAFQNQTALFFGQSIEAHKIHL